MTQKKKPAYFPEPVFAKNGQNCLTHQVFLGLVPSDFPKSWGSCPWTLLRRGGGRPGEGLVQHVGAHLHVFLAPVACFWSILDFFFGQMVFVPSNIGKFWAFLSSNHCQFFWLLSPNIDLKNRDFGLSAP